MIIGFQQILRRLNNKQLKINLIRNQQQKIHNNLVFQESFITVKKDNPFPIQNIPFGVFKIQNDDTPKIGVAIGESVVNVSDLVKLGYFQDFSLEIQQSLQKKNLNKFFGFSKEERNSVRKHIQRLLSKESVLEKDKKGRECIYEVSKVKMEMPIEVGDYTDFYASRNHAENVGEMFRGKDNKLMPNWLHMPIAYHGRSSTLNINSTFHRPQGQIEHSQFAQESKLDFELEVACILGGTLNKQGHSIEVHNARDNIVGFSLLNDLSARAIQRIEYVPLGPFLGKNFSTVISPWIVFEEALECFSEKRQNQSDSLANYLIDKKNNSLNFFNIPLQVYLKPKGSDKKHLISETNMRNLYWSFDQMIAHHSVNGCEMRVGDVIASGTISGDDRVSQAGSLLELTWNGTQPIILEGGVQRKFLEDGDTIILQGGQYIPGTNQFIGFGPVSSTVLPCINK